MIVSELRISRVAEAFRVAGGLKFAKAFEEADPQMKAAQKLCSVSSYLTPLLLAINACVSYVLAGRGEEYWSSFADYVASAGRCPSTYLEVTELVKEFVSESKYHRLARAAKLSRLSKLARCSALKRFEDPHAEFVTNPRSLLRVLTDCLKSSGHAKTVVFAVKMYYYGVKACLGIDLVLPDEVEVPVDRRVAYLAYTSGMLEVSGGTSREEVIRKLMVQAEVVRLVWDRVAKLSGIPPLHLDAPLWIIGRYVGLGKSVEDVIEEVEELLGGRVPRDKLELVVRELLHRLT
ncbi:MAG: N-glycosylase/DNA lyase [Desulfurococcales archaeon]|nr:N-glycosylase/DNA lyase [Desulfurococcales archaeon]